MFDVHVHIKISFSVSLQRDLAALDSSCDSLTRSSTMIRYFLDDIYMCHSMQDFNSNHQTPPSPSRLGTWPIHSKSPRRTSIRSLSPRSGRVLHIPLFDSPRLSPSSTKKFGLIEGESTGHFNPSLGFMFQHHPFLGRSSIELCTHSHVQRMMLLVRNPVTWNRPLCCRSD